MTREVDGHSDHCTQTSQGPSTTTGGEHLWWEAGKASSLVVSLGKALNGIVSTFEWLDW